jgi:hypothetical protein
VSALPDDEDLDYVIEIRTKRTESRAENLQQRSDRMRDALGALGLKRLGVWIEVPEAAWSQITR